MNTYKVRTPNNPNHGYHIEIQAFDAAEACERFARDCYWSQSGGVDVMIGKRWVSMQVKVSFAYTAEVICDTDE